MRRIRVWAAPWILTALLLCPLNGLSFETETHRLINQNAAQELSVEFFDQQISFSEFLRIWLGFSNGLATIIDGQSILEWIGIGGVAEDQFLANEILGGLTRSPRHFHTPLRTWDQSGLDLFVVQFQSSVRWAQNPSQSPGGRASWKDARDTYFRAVTGSTKSERDKAFAETFQILGQLMHLVADLGSPPHTRNDPHPFSYSIESFMGKEENQALITGFEKVDPSILKQPTGDPVAKVPVARLWDTDSYNGANPGVTTGSTTDGANIGLAEFSSANFFSTDTILQSTCDDSDLPFPAIDQLSPGPIDPYPTSTSPKRRQYLSKIGDGVDIDHMVAEGVFVRFLPTPAQVAIKKAYVLDDLVFKDYASELLPRAIGYSAGLLGYFFRGRIFNFTSDLPCSVIDYFQEGQIKLAIENGTINEDTATGQMVIVVQYMSGGQTFFLVSDTKTIRLTRDSQEIVFNIVGNSIPDSATNLSGVIVYRGKLGLEDDAVVASPLGIIGVC